MKVKVPAKKLQRIETIPGMSVFEFQGNHYIILTDTHAEGSHYENFFAKKEVPVVDLSTHRTGILPWGTMVLLVNAELIIKEI